MENQGFSPRTDLALEAREMVGDVRTELSGIKVESEQNKDLHLNITKVQVLNEEGEKQIHKPIGNYITIESDAFKNSALENKKEIVERIATELKQIMDFSNKLILVIGLGNHNVTPDALGPMTVSKLIVTRHLFQEFDNMGDVLQKVSALVPGVMGQTGMETVEIIKGVVEIIKPDVVVAIDALASRKTKRVNATIQISDTGVHPGSGVGNRRKGLTMETLGVPVIAIGVPTVVDAATIVSDTLDELIKQFKKIKPSSDSIMDSIVGLEDHEKYQLIKEVLNPYLGDLFVTPKEIDEVIIRLSDIVSLSLNLALHPKMTYEEVLSFVS